MRGIGMKGKVFALLIVLLVLSLNTNAATPNIATSDTAALDQAVRVFYNYDEDISNIRKAIDMYNRVIRTSDSPDVLYNAYYGIAMAYLTMGDFAKLNHTDALEDYEAGKIAARRAIELNQNGSEGYFWYAGNIGRIAQRKNIIEALLLLPEFLGYLNKAYELNPESLFVLEAYAELYYQLPWAFGGSDGKSIEYIDKALKIDPGYTMPLTTLAKVYIKEGKYDEARDVLKEVLNFKDPSYRAGWVMYDKPFARKLLDFIKDKK
jgi:tetratricopeptide (TPR) repeat protein